MRGSSSLTERGELLNLTHGTGVLHEGIPFTTGSSRGTMKPLRCLNNMRRFHLAASQFAVLLAALLAIAWRFSIMFAPERDDPYARLTLRQFEQRFGFTTGSVQVPDGQGGHVEL